MNEISSFKEEKCNSSSSNAKLGIYLFFVYLIVYAAFVAVTLISPMLMNTRIVAGLNLACTYGFGLIVLAIIMGIIYNSLCTRSERKRKTFSQSLNSHGEEQ